MSARRKSIGVALGGGGARGLTHIGVLQGLHEHQGPVEYLAGTSIGSVVGAMYAATLDPQWITDRFLNFIGSDDYRSLGLDRFKPRSERIPTIFKAMTSQVRQYVKIAMANNNLGLLRIERLRSVIEHLLPVETFAELQIPFRCAAVDLHSGQDIIFSEGSLIDAVTASSAVPGFIQPWQADGRMITDGGVSIPVPVDVVRDMGAEFVLAVDVKLNQFDQLETPNMMQILSRSEQITSHRLSILLDQQADVVIMPDTRNLFWSEFDQIDILIQNGYQAVCNQMKEIQSKQTKTLWDCLRNRIF